MSVEIPTGGPQCLPNSDGSTQPTRPGYPPKEKNGAKRQCRPMRDFMPISISWEELRGPRGGHVHRKRREGTSTDTCHSGGTVGGRPSSRQ